MYTLKLDPTLEAALRTWYEPEHDAKSCAAAEARRCFRLVGNMRGVKKLARIIDFYDGTVETVYEPAAARRKEVA